LRGANRGRKGEGGVMGMREREGGKTKISGGWGGGGGGGGKGGDAV